METLGATRSASIRLMALAAATLLAGCLLPDRELPRRSQYEVQPVSLGKARGHLRAEGGDAQIIGATVTITGFKLRSPSGLFYKFKFDVPKTIELISLSGATFGPLLAAGQVPDGYYDQIRIMTEATGTVTLTDNSTQELRFPSGPTSGIKFFPSQPIEIKNGTVTKIDAVIDLSSSFIITGTGFTNFMPVIRADVTTYTDPTPDDDEEPTPPGEDDGTGGGIIIYPPATDDGDFGVGV